MNDTKKVLSLRGLTEAERDAKVNEAVAQTQGFSDFCWIAKTLIHDRRMMWSPDKNDHIPLPPYATSADAVLPLLEKWLNEIEYEGRCLSCEMNGPKDWRVLLWTDIDEDDEVNGEAEIFPLAACYALLRANGIEVLP